MKMKKCYSVEYFNQEGTKVFLSFDNFDEMMKKVSHLDKYGYEYRILKLNLFK